MGKFLLTTHSMDEYMIMHVLLISKHTTSFQLRHELPPQLINVHKSFYAFN